MQKVLQTKERIMELIRQRGPELPVRIANTIKLSNIFTAAFMSELISEQKLKISNMRVGASPLYYIQGQEEQLQKYTDYLNHKEKEAFNLLKQNSILQDSEQEPAIRVALRSIKDFAVPLQIIDKGETKIFWKIHTLTNEMAKNIVEQKLNPPPINKEIKKEKITNEEILEEKLTKKPKLQKSTSSEFLNGLKEILLEKNIEITQEIFAKKKEFVAKVRTDTPFGKQEFYLVAKEKKKITTDDLVCALQRAQAEKMPALILSTGEIDKKAHDYHKEWKNLIKHEKIRP